jgi:hypothetical protein
MLQTAESMGGPVSIKMSNELFTTEVLKIGGNTPSATVKLIKLEMALFQLSLIVSVLNVK